MEGLLQISGARLTAEDLIAFEQDIAQLFDAGLIRSPVHLAGGNEEALIDIFKWIDPKNDWVAVQWRSHYHALLKGVPSQEVKQAILDGRSIAMCFPKYRVIASALVGGIAPIAMGIAWGIKRGGKRGKVWCFLGDMTAKTGIVGETLQYAMGHDLPIQFVIEDNGKSVCTDTKAAWGEPVIPSSSAPVRSYQYEMSRAHVGTGTWVRF